MMMGRKSNEWINNLWKHLRKDFLITIVIALKTILSSLTWVNPLHARMTKMIQKNKYFTSNQIVMSKK